MKLAVSFFVAALVMQQVACQELNYTVFTDLCKIEGNENLPCQEDGGEVKLERLSSRCRVLGFFNRTQIELMDELEARKLSEDCACELAHMQDLWHDSFHYDQSTERLFAIVARHLGEYQNKVREASKAGRIVEHPVYLWSDIDVLVEGVSIYFSTQDFMKKRLSDRSYRLSRQDRAKMSDNVAFQLTETVCQRIIDDPYKLYRYMENLARMDPLVLFKLLRYSGPVESTYQASKACKWLMINNVHRVKLYPDNRDVVIVDELNELTLSQALALAKENPNLIHIDNSNNDLEDGLVKDASLLLLNCTRWQEKKLSLEELEFECPFMFMSTEKLPGDWIVKHPSATDRSKLAIKCGCQLLMHNATWNEMMQDSNVQLMSKAVMKYMEEHRMPDFSGAPLWTLYAWFEGIMDRFKKNKKMSVKEIVRELRGDLDPSKMISKTNLYEEKALELLRRGCNYIMFNYKKGSVAASEMKLVKYLDNLQAICDDPMFVFHLSLLDANLFHIHTLSKMCKPVVY